MTDTPSRKDWKPTRITRHIESRPTGAGAILVATDAGNGFLKAMGNPAGEHALACELVGTQLATWFGLSTFDFAIIRVVEVPELPFAHGGLAKPGPGFITRQEVGETWGGKARQLRRLVNPEDITRLVVFDTWTLNCDRHAPDNLRRPNRDNVFLSAEAPGSKLLLRAIDHTHCFTCGRDLTRRLATLERMNDPRVYGRFPEFGQFLDKNVARRAAARLRQVSRKTLSQIVQTIPREWDVSTGARDALASFLLGRAAYVADSIMGALWGHTEFGFMNDEED